MRFRTVKYAALLLALVLVGTCLSWLAIYSFWFGVWVFHSVPAARACDALGRVVLFPSRCVLPFMGDQSTPLFQPLWHAGVNGLLLAVVAHAFLRKHLFRAA